MKDLPERELAVFPFFHLAGFTAVMTFAIRMGWTDILVPRPEARTVLNMMIKHKPTVVPAVPTIYVGLLGLPDFKDADLSFVKGFFCAAAPLALETINDLKKATGAQMVEGYGLSESTGLVTLTPWRGVLKQGSAGVPLPDTDMKIVDLETGTTELPGGTRGGNHLPWSSDVQGLLQHAGRDRKGHPGRVVPHRRYRQGGRGRIRLYRGQEEGHDHRRGLQHLPEGHRRGPVRASEGPGGVRRGRACTRTGERP